MSLLVGYDGFDYAAGTLPTPWTLKTGDIWQVDGNRAWAYDTVNPVGVVGGTARLAILGDFYALISTVAGSKLMRVQCSLLMPSVLSSAFTMQAGIVGFSSGANSTPHLECVWERTSGGTNTLRLYLRTSGGQTLLSSTSIAAVAASESHDIRAQFYMTTAGLQVAIYWDSVLTVAVGFPNSWLALQGFGTAQSNPHYVGLFGTSSGVSNTGSFGTPVYVATAPVLIDDFKVFDEGYTDTATPIYAAPTLTADLISTYPTIAVQAENDSTGDTFVLRPSYAIQVDPQYSVREHAFDGGYTQTVARSSGRRRRWSLKWDALSSAQRSTFVTHIATVGGKKKAFAWQDPDTGIAVTVRFVEDPVISQVAPSVWSATAVAEEIGG